MIFGTESAAIGAYRERTEKNAGKMIGVRTLTFVCKKCGQIRAVAGRKSLGHKAGFKCAGC